MDADALIMSAYFGLALALALACVLIFGLSLNIEKSWRSWIVPMIYPIIIFSIGISTALSGRHIDREYFSTAVALGESAGGAGSSWILRLGSLAIVGLCLVRIFASVNIKENKTDGMFALIFWFMAFHLTNYLFSAIFGTHPNFNYKYMYAVLVFLAVYMSRQNGYQITIKSVKVSLLIFFILTFMAVVAMPSLVIDSSYDAGLLGLKYRLWGLVAHANNLAPLGLLLLALTLNQPFSSKALNRISCVTAMVIMLLAQSKTTWLVAIIVIPIQLYYKRNNHAEKSAKNLKYQTTLLYLSAISILIAVLLIAIMVSNLENGWLESVNLDHFLTFTGRDRIWTVAISEWKKNILFGYGPTIWDTEFRKLIGMNYAATAHSQFFQSLSMAGSLGFAGMVIYLIVLGKFSISARHQTAGLSLGIFLILFFRCFTETPLVTGYIMAAEIVGHLLLFHICVAYSYDQQSSTTELSPDDA